MTLRSTLAAIFALLLACSVAAVGFVFASSARATLIQPIDTRLERLGETISQTGVGAFQLPTGGPSGPGPDQRFDQGPRPEGRDTAVMQYLDGDQTASTPSGFDSDPDPLPEFSVQDAANLESGSWRLVDLTSTGPGYRAVVIVESTPISGVTEPGRTVTLFAVPLDTVDATVGEIRETAAITAIIALAIGATLAWLIVRLAFRPVDKTIDAAAEIGNGNVGLRVPEPARPAEIRSLGSSINAMVARLERSTEAETAARVALSQFVADASHELRTPIAAISGHAELIRSGALDGASSERSVDRIGSEARRMHRLVEDLLTLASHDSGARRTHREVNLSGIVTDSVEDARAIDIERTYEVTTPTAASMVGDSEQLQQVVANLLANVRTHTPPGTTAKVTLIAGPDKEWLLSVHDDGPGIPVEAQGQLFERFYRAPGAKSGSGAGLGLALVSALIEEHDGTIAIKSIPGDTTFTVRLPRGSMPRQTT